jgi:hypothetical protein
MIIPFSEAYAAAGGFSLVVALKKRWRNFAPLGVVLFTLGALTRCAEDWRRLESLGFLRTELILLAFFICGYALFSTKLILIRFHSELSQAILGSASHILVASLGALGYVSFLVRSNENPPFAVLIFLALVCALHVPMFIAFRKRAIPGDLNQPAITARSISSFAFWGSLIIIATPFLITSASLLSSGGDWRIILLTAVISASLSTLLWISR